MINISYHSCSQVVIEGPELNIIREHFSVKNEAAHFQRRMGRFVPSRTYVISNNGKVDVGLVFEIVNFCTDKKIEYTIEEKVTSTLIPSLKKEKVNNYDLSLSFRDYQQEIINKCINTGRGTVVLATAGGKTLTMAGLLEYYYQNFSKNFKCLIIVPDLGLVNQTKGDFKEYKTSYSTSKWTGKDELNLSSNVIVANLGILQSSKQDISWIEHIDLLIIDEVHKLRRGNKVNKILCKVKTNNRFGFTGTLPPDNLDAWNIFGKIGPRLYEKMAHELRDEKYVTPARVHVLEINYNTPTNQIYQGNNSNAFYLQESEFIRSNVYRNNLISKLCKKLDNNALILVDYIEHGELLTAALQEICKKKKVYFIQGSVETDERKRIQNYMEKKKNIVVVAISKIFSTGINIKNLHYIIFAGGGKAKIKIVQSIGRGLRLHTDKEELIIFDIADNLRYGQRHVEERLTLYDNEDIKYKFTSYNERSETETKKEKS
jgi:superfamily II DNA or RNA helicase